jgi:hypothetical protein
MDISIIIITFVVCYLILMIARKSGQKRKTHDKTFISNTSSGSKRIDRSEQYFAWPELMEYDFEVVGESYYQPAIKKIAEQQAAKCINNPEAKFEPLTAHLIPDDYNQYDDKAVRVDIDGMQVGHLSREDARSFRRRLGAKKLTGQVTTCGALVTGGHIKNGKQADYGIVLDMKPFE